MMNEIAFLVIIFLLGSIFGSFFNVVGLRIPMGLAFHHGRSICLSCMEPLHWYELIPIFSFILQKGRCRSCYVKLSPLYPIIEWLTGILYVLCYIKFGMQFEFFVAIVFISMLMIISVSDFVFMI